MLSRDPHERPSADEILAKPFLKSAVERNRRIPDALKCRLLTSIDPYSEYYKDFETVVSEWETATDSLEEIHHNCTIGSLSGAVIGAAGGITAGAISAVSDCIWCWGWCWSCRLCNKCCIQNYQ